MQESENGHGDIITGGNVILMHDTHTSFRALKYIRLVASLSSSWIHVRL